MSAATLPEVDLGVDLDAEVVCVHRPPCEGPAHWLIVTRHSGVGDVCASVPKCDPHAKVASEVIEKWRGRLDCGGHGLPIDGEVRPL